MIRVFHIFVPTRVLALLVSEVLIVASIFIAATYLVLEGDPTVFLINDSGLLRILIIVLSILMGNHCFDLYSSIRVRSHMQLFLQLCQCV